VHKITQSVFKTI